MTKDKANIEEIKIKIQNICMDTENEMNFDRATVYMDFTQKIAEYIAEDYTPNSQIQQSNEKYAEKLVEFLILELGYHMNWEAPEHEPMFPEYITTKEQLLEAVEVFKKEQREQG